LEPATPHPLLGQAAFRRAALIVIILTIVRLLGLKLSSADLFSDEAQYWSWSRELAFGYFSKPPLIAWVIAAAEELCGTSEACVRAPAPVLYAGSALLAFGLGQSLYDSRVGFWSAMLVAWGTGTIFSARIISTDVPLLFFWALALVAYARLRKQADWHWALLLGVAIGAGLLSKYAMIYFLPGMLVAAAWEKRARALLRAPQLALTVIAAALVVLPNVMWNLAHGFLEFREATSAVSGEPLQPSLIRPLEFVLTQFAVFGPVVFAVALAAMARLRSPRICPQDRVLVAFAAPPLVIITATAVFVHTYGNWAAVSALPLAVLSAAMLVRWNLMPLLWVSLGLGIVGQIAAIGADHYATEIRSAFPNLPNPYVRTLGWRSYAQTAGELARKRALPTIAAETRADVAALLYYWRDQPETILAWSNSDYPAFDLTRGLTQSAREPVLFVSECPFVGRLERYYGTVMPLGAFAPQDVVVRPFNAFLLENPRGPIGILAPCRAEQELDREPPLK
jgi:4-amino-4-deoxy-L-arabinose transferase-like glycosyltransferase